MSLADVSIRRPVFAWMLMAGLIIFGWISFQRLGVSQMPDVDFPVLTISVDWPGAAPEVMESEIVDRIEQAIVSVEGIRDIISTIRQGQTAITIEFNLTRDIDAALQEVQSAVTRVKMPTDVDPPTIQKTNPDDQPIMWLGLNSERSFRDLIEYVDLKVKDKFQTLPGVGEVILGGFVERNLRVWADNEKLRQYELTILDIKRALQLGHIETAAGVIENDKNESNIRVMGEGLTPEEVSGILITQRGGRPIYNTTIRIGDVARVENGLNDIRKISRVNGIQGIGLGIKKQRGANAVAVGDVVKAKLAEVQATLPKDIQMGVNFDSTKFIQESVSETNFTLVLSAIVTGLVCWFFLGSWSPTFNILLSIPTSIIGTFSIIYFMGFTLNFFTILGLALAVGIVVDDAIMVLENIYRHLEMGKNPVRAALDGANEITFAAVAASVAVIAIFLPVAFMKGVIGKFFFQFGVTISAAVGLSLLEAVTLTPMRCSQMLSASEKEGAITGFINEQFNRLSGLYRRILGRALSFRWTVIALSIVFFAGSLFLFKFLPKEFIPAQDQSMFLLRYQTPVGTSITSTSETMKEAEKFLLARPEVNRVYTAVGGFTGGEVNAGIMFVSMKDPNKRKMSQGEFMDLCRTELGKLKDTKVFLQDLSTRGFTAQRGFPVEFNIRGGSWDELNDAAQKVVDNLKATGLVVDIDTDYRRGMPEVRVAPNRDRAAASGVSVEDIGQTVLSAIGGVKAGKYTENGRRYDVRLRLEGSERADAEALQKLEIRNDHGEIVPLADVIQVQTIPTLQTITRRNRERSISVFANVAPGASQAAALAAAEKIGAEVLPPGYKLYLGGGAQTFIESFQSLKFVLIMGVIVAYMILASQFNSFVHPFTVLLALPFSISGAVLGLLMGHQSLNLFSIIGIILLMGIVKKNSILLVEFMNKKRDEEGLPLRDAVLEAAPVRLRPILMTSFATIAAAVPPALALGPGAESRVPMAITVIGGVVVSTLFTLLVVPCAYSLMSSLERRRTVEEQLKAEAA